MVSAADEQLRQIAGLASEGGIDQAIELSTVALAERPDDQRFLRAKAILLRKARRSREAEWHLVEVLRHQPQAAWAHAQLGLVLQHREAARAIEHFRLAHALEPRRDHTLALVHALGRLGDGAALEEAYQLLRPILPSASSWTANDLHIAYHVLGRVCAFDELAQLGDPMGLGRKWAEAGDHTALFLLLGSVREDQDRLDILELHRIAATHLVQAVAR